MELLYVIHDVICYYCWWSLFYGLGPMIWFYPLNELDITGYEAFAAVWLIPIITAIPLIRRFLSTFLGILLLEIIMAFGIASFQMGTTLTRLMVLAVGNAAAMLFICGKLFSGSTASKLRQWWLLLGANFLFLASRVWMTSIAPAWADYQTNWMVVSVLSVSIATHFLMKTASMIRGSKDEADQKTGQVSDKHAGNKKGFTIKNTVETPFSPGFLRQISYGLLFGSLCFFTHWVFGDLCVLSRWSTTGATNPSSLIIPFLTAPFVFLAIIAGSFFATSFQSFCSSIFCWILGSAVFFGAYFRDSYAGFISGLILASYCTILWVMSFRKFCTSHPAIVVFIGMLVYMAQIFFHVWTVAYNFVPGGIYTRERSDLLIGFMCLTFLAAHGKYGGVLKKSDRPKSICVIVLIALVITGAGTWKRYPMQPVAKTLNAEHRDFTAIIWTFHFGYDNQGWPSLQRAAELLKETNADVIALLESDASKPYLGHNDLAMWLGEKLGMFVDFGPATKDHTWGNLLLSKYPIIHSTHHLLPSPHGELAPAISATLNMSGNLVDIISTHMGNDRDVLDRQLQTQYLANLSAQSSNPVVFLGYVTSKPFSQNYFHFMEKGLLKDIDPTDKQRFCEYILYRRLIRQGYARISHGGLSDTELQLGKFSIPRNIEDYQDNDIIEKDPGKVEIWKRFSVYLETKGTHNNLLPAEQAAIQAH